jgi:soluble lytic murein transglycosylase-like protein
MRILILILAICVTVVCAYADMYQTVTPEGTMLYSNVAADNATTVFKEDKPDRKATLKKQKNSGSYHVIVDEKSRKHNVDPRLVKAVIAAESGWNPMAISPKGAVGIMQLMPKTASDMGVSNRYNPEENIEGGIKYLRHLLDKFRGNLTMALAAYNAGPARVEKVKGVPSIPETVNYVRKVMNTYSGGPAANWSPGGDSPKIRMVTLEDGSVLFTNAYNPGSISFSN